MKKIIIFLLITSISAEPIKSIKDCKITKIRTDHSNGSVLSLQCKTLFPEKIKVRAFNNRSVLSVNFEMTPDDGKNSSNGTIEFLNDFNLQKIKIDQIADEAPIDLDFYFTGEDMPDNVTTQCLYKKGNEDKFVVPEEKLNYHGALNCKVFTVEYDSQPAHGVFYEMDVTPEAIKKGKAFFVKKDKVIV